LGDRNQDVRYLQAQFKSWGFPSEPETPLQISGTFDQAISFWGLNPFTVNALGCAKLYGNAKTAKMNDESAWLAPV